MPVKVYHKPVITIWDDEALSGIRARMDYGLSVWPTPAPGSISNPYELSEGVESEFSGVRGSVWFRCLAFGAVDVIVRNDDGTAGGMSIYVDSTSAPHVFATIAPYPVETHVFSVRSHRYYIGVNCPASTTMKLLVKRHVASVRNDCVEGKTWMPSNPDIRPYMDERCVSRAYLTTTQIPVFRACLDGDVWNDIWQFLVLGPYDEGAMEAFAALVSARLGVNVAPVLGVIGWVKNIWDLCGVLNNTLLATQIDSVAETYTSNGELHYRFAIVVDTYASLQHESGSRDGAYVSRWHADAVPPDYATMDNERMYGAPGYDNGIFSDNG